MNETLRRSRHLAIVLAVVLAAAGCGTAVASPSTAPAVPAHSEFPGVVVVTPWPRDSGDNIVRPDPTMPSWFAVPMVDVNTGKSFTMQQFTGKVVLMDTMATWCPTCQGEMSQMQDLLKTLGPSSDLVLVSIDVDPNEDAELLKKYTAQNGFDWRIAIAPEAVTRFLISNYDQMFLNPPLQPMLFIDKQGSVYGLPTGIKSAESLRLTLEQYLK